MDMLSHKDGKEGGTKTEAGREKDGGEVYLGDISLLMWFVLGGYYFGFLICQNNSHPAH